MGKLIFELSDDERSMLERRRIDLGLRSHAETLRALIRGDGGEPAMADAPSPRPSFSHGRSKTVVVPAAKVRVEVPMIERKTFNPQPKTGAKK